MWEILKSYSRLINYLIVALLAGYGYIAYSYINNVPHLEPGQGTNQYIINPTLRVGEPLEMFVQTSVDQTMCHVFVDRHIIRTTDGQIVYEKVFKIQQELLEGFNKGPTKLTVPLPLLKPDSYFYYSIIYLFCNNKTSYVRTSDLLPFQVIP